MKIMVKRTTTNENQKASPILWFLFAIVIPIIVALTLTVIMLSVAGVNVADLAKNAGSHIPGVSSLITTDEKKQAEQKEGNAKDVIKQKDEKIDELERNVADLETTVEDLELEAEKDENSTSDKLQDDMDKDTDEKENGKQQDSTTSIAASFKDMQPGKAASIFEKLDEDKALTILDKLSNKARGDIFQEMEPELAATLTKKLMDQD